MYCPRCGKDIPPRLLVCSRCGARGVGSAFPLLGIPRIPVAARVVALWTRLARRTGSEPRYTLEPGEVEIYRTEIDGMSQRIVERHSRLTGPATCVLTNRRLLVCPPLGEPIGIALSDIQAAHTHRDLAASQAYWVALHEHSSDFTDRRGTICLSFRENRGSQELSWHIRDALHEGNVHRHAG